MSQVGSATGILPSRVDTFLGGLLAALLIEVLVVLELATAAGGVAILSRGDLEGGCT